MRKTIHLLSATLILFLFTNTVKAQDYTFDDFVGTWNGTIFSPSTNGATVPMTMVIEPDGFYTETSGALMPSLYPDTQECEYLAESNRMHWWYLGTAWGGQYFYDHFFYTVVSFENGVLEMHYNFWNDPEPHPQTGIIYLVKEGATVIPPPDMLSYQWIDNTVLLNWNMPDPGNGQLAELTGYNIYHQLPGGDPEFVEFTEELSYTHQADFSIGAHNYYLTAVYDGDESVASNIVSIIFLSPAPTMLEGMLVNDMIELSWAAPDAGDEPMANLEGYNIYHKPENGSYEMLAYVEDNYFVHEALESTGTHTYYVTAKYNGGVSEATNALDVLYYITRISDDQNIETSIYPNPATDFLNITSAHTLQEIKLLNQSGQVVNADRVNTSNYQLDVRSLQAGVYILIIEAADETSSQTIVVK